MKLIVSKQAAKQMGRYKYFTGKECPHGHLAEKYVNNGECIECRKNKNREFYRVLRTNSLNWIKYELSLNN